MNKDYLYYREQYLNSLSHHGVKGQKWGIRNEKDISSIPKKSGNTGQKLGATIGGAGIGAGAAWLTTLGAAATTQAFLAYKMGKDSNSVADVIRLAHKGQNAMNVIGKVAYPIAVASLATAGGLIGYNVAKKRSPNKPNNQK